MINKKIFFSIIILFLCLNLAEARVHGEGVYGSHLYSRTEYPSTYCGDGICNNGETCSTCPQDCGVCPTTVTEGGGGGGSTSCTYDWQCTDWFPTECPESGIQERVCANKGTCTGTAGMPTEVRECEYLGPTEPLFDIFLTLDKDSKEICSGNKIKADVRLENYGKVELLDAFMTYWVLSENNTLIAELKDTRAVESEKEYPIEIKIPSDTQNGTYKLYAQIVYDGNKTAIAGESFNILSQEECEYLKKFDWKILIYCLLCIFIVIFIFFIILLFKRRKKEDKDKKPKKESHSNYKTKVKTKLKKIRKRSYLFILGFIALASLFKIGNKLTGSTVGSNITKINWGFNLILIVFLVGFLIYKNKSKIKINKQEESYPSDSLAYLVGRKVYTTSGTYIGIVKEFVLDKKRILSLKIGLDKKWKTEFKGILVKYENILDVGDIVLIEEKLLEKLNI